MDWTGVLIAVLGSSMLGASITAWVSRRTPAEKDASAADTITGASQKLVGDMMAALDRTTEALRECRAELKDCYKR